MSSTPIKVAPYEKVYKIYDKLMEHVDYEDWANYIDEMIQHHRPESKTILDVACGTGSFLPFFYEFGYDPVGVEISKPMLESAHEKVDLLNIPLIEADMVALELKDRFDVIVCLFDSVNYLKHFRELIRFLNRMATHLKPNGIFIFDIVTQFACKEHFGDFTENDTLNNIDFERRCIYDFNENIQDSYFRILDGDQAFEEHHQQKIFSDEEITQAVSRSNLKLIATHGDFDLDPIDDETERAHYVLEHQ